METRPISYFNPENNPEDNQLLPDLHSPHNILERYKNHINNFDEQIEEASIIYRKIVDYMDQYPETAEGYFRAKSDFYEAKSEVDDIKIKKLEYLANHDEKTGALNEIGFKKSLFEHLESAQRIGQTVLVMVGDGNKFKGLNDTYGHAAGDKMLEQFAEVGMHAIEEAARTHSIDDSGQRPNSRRGGIADEIARLHGDEFAVVMTLPEKAAKNVANRIRRILKKVTIEYEGQTVVSGMTLGAVAVNFGDKQTKITEEMLDNIIKDADEDLYNNKPKDSSPR